MGGDLERGIDEEGAAPVRTVERALDDLLDKGANRLFWRQRRFEAGDALAGRALRLTPEHQAGQRTPVAGRDAEGPVVRAPARRAGAHRGSPVTGHPKGISAHR